MTLSGEYVFLNGRIMPASQAAISPFDAGLLRGYAVFDLLQTLRGEPFMMGEHLKRFRNSAEMLGLSVPLSDEQIVAIVRELLALNGHVEATVRLVLTGGVSPDGMHFDPATPTFFIVTHELFEVPPAVYEQGTRLLAVEHRRELPEAKTTGYLTWLLNHARLEDEGAMDLLYHRDGVISEAATASFYVVRGGRIYAPDDGVLWGTVGVRVLGLAAREFEVVHGDVTLSEALGADECFLTSSVRGVVPIVQIDDHVIGDGLVGPITRRLMDRFARAVAEGEIL
jgi:branched-subunit amino acid aminotransferase/4-amino-4-deoxychorismate lyase